MSRNFLVMAVAAVSLVAFSAAGFAEETTMVKGDSNKGQQAPDVVGALRHKGAGTTTVNGTKSNADRMGGGGGHSQTTKVKGSKSNTSDRMSGDTGSLGRVRSGVSVDLRSKSNTSDRMGGGGGVRGGGSVRE
jgi:hypothetical protein